MCGEAASVGKQSGKCGDVRGVMSVCGVCAENLADCGESTEREAEKTQEEEEENAIAMRQTDRQLSHPDKNAQSLFE